eukprot:TRINITY_DN33026_c0_g1_i1.p1 TRINITY_DN33026_c0_g1~~TRINITY_DN33026_c0_g1_i1.p1  ORF type:complete len:185 (+),score=37.51 TRINITY_DN33026_c0_g1_i1:71-625(+)
MAARRGALLLCTAAAACAEPESVVVRGEEDIMRQRAHGTCPHAPQRELLWGVAWDEADRVCCFNRRYAEHRGYWAKTLWDPEVAPGPVSYYDSVSGRRLFRAPVGRSAASFRRESAAHGWPSFRDSEVDWRHVRVLSDGEVVSVDGTHLGHNIPDARGNRYCINLVSVAGRPADAGGTGEEYEM